MALGATNGVRYSFEGPFGLYDVVGWDLIETVAEDLFGSLCNDTDGHELAKEMIAAGNLGLKSGRGAYDYSGVDRSKFMNDRSAKIVKMHKAIKEL